MIFNNVIAFVALTAGHFLSAQALAAAGLRRASIVTGANGYVGREIVHTLLQQPDVGEIVCLVRSARIPEEAQYWENNNTVCVKVMPYDMLDGGESLTNALDCVYDHEGEVECCVYHVASVFGPTDDHVQTALNNVRGTETIVKVISKYNKCKLVLTSSMAAVRGTGQSPAFGTVYTHQDWNTLSNLGDNWGASYQWSKAESERRAWALSRDLNVPMVSLCPSFVFGPPSDGCQSKSYSITLVGQWVRGESPVQSRLCVDVRDVALAHVRAATLPTAVGNRYIVSKEARIPSQGMAEALRLVATNPGKITYDADFKGGAIPIGDREVEAENRLQQDLGGLVLRPVEETLADMGRMLVQMEKVTKS